jgi:hypothetical protein
MDDQLLTWDLNGDDEVFTKVEMAVSGGQEEKKITGLSCYGRT